MEIWLEQLLLTIN